MDIDTQFVNSKFLDRISDLVNQVSLGGGVGTSLNHLPRPGVSRAGEGLELWVKHFLAGTINRPDKEAVLAEWNNSFSFHGGTNNPPDVMMRNSLAAEVKKTEGASGTLQLNSSWPIRTLRVDDQHITQDCRDSESWDEKPFLLFVGKVDAKTASVRSLWIIDGRCLSDNEDVYVSLMTRARFMMKELGGDATKEIGKFNQVDALSRTSLRVRPMFSLVHPAVIFNNVFQSPGNESFLLNILIPSTTYQAFSSDNRVRLESLNNGLNVNSVVIDDPTGSSKSIPAVHIFGSW